MKRSRKVDGECYRLVMKARQREIWPATTRTSPGGVDWERGGGGKPTLRPWGSFCEQECGAKVPELPRAGAEGESDLAEAGQEREGSGQMDDDAAHRAQHARAELQQALSQGPHLRSRALGPGGPQAQFLQQHVGGRRQQHAELIGPEIGATGAVDLESLVQLLDPVFDVPALA